MWTKIIREYSENENSVTNKENELIWFTEIDGACYKND